MKLDASFFERPVVDCARDLVGATFIWGECAGRIVETEAYSAQGDEACHTFFRPGARQFVGLHAAGTAYVYMNYGVHWLFNVLVKGPHGAGFVLLRALEPARGVEIMRRNRGVNSTAALCSGPGKLTQALGIHGTTHGKSFLNTDGRGIVIGPPIRIEATTRIGISRSRELPWRFIEPGNPNLSR